jgi:TusA-related sulfurtransferase
MNQDKIKPLYTVDTCGYCCPIPMTSTLKVLARIKPGEIIEVKATDHAYSDDIRIVENMGKLKIIEEIEYDDYMYYVIEKL